MKLKIYKDHLKGFTLLELMVVISIIGVLLAGAFFSYIQIIERSRVNQAISDIQDIRRAIESYHLDLGFYPPDTGRGTDPGLATPLRVACTGTPLVPCPRGYDHNLIADASNNPIDWRGPYLETWPVETPWGGEYDYDYYASGIPTTQCSTGGPAGIYVGIKPASGSSGAGSVPQDAKAHFIANRTDSCPTIANQVFMMIKPL